MSKFTSLNVASLFNASRESDGWHPKIGPYLVELPYGQQVFWGIPFLLGSNKDRCWIMLDRNRGNITIPINGQASFILIAHLCDASHDITGKKAQPVDYEVGTITEPGELLANYFLVYTDGTEYCQAIRRRFEIGEAFTSWGQWPFVAWPHIEDEPRDWRGPYPATQWGWYQTSIGKKTRTGPLQYWIYALENPHPDRGLSSLCLVPSGLNKLVVAGITLYHGQEHPLRYHRLETLKITLPKNISLNKLKAEIDLGIIARLYSIPNFKPEAWLADQVKGWGEEVDVTPMGWEMTKPSPEPISQIFLDVTASPDATLKIENHEFDMLPIYKDGKTVSYTGKARIELLTPHKTWIHASVVDEDTGKPTPVRVHFRTPDGRYLPPYGHRMEVNDNWFEDYGGDLKLGSTSYAYVDGRFQIELPVGEVYVEIAKGFEYQPLRERLVIQPDQNELKLHIKRALNWRKKGWLTADTHVHFLSPQTAWLEAQAEGVNLVNLLASQWGDLFTNVVDITGGESRVSHNDTIIWVGTENRQHMLGHISLLGVKGEPVFPMCSSGPDESYLGDPTWTSLADWADLCRERDGLVVIPHFPNPYCEVAADIVLDKVDAVEIRDFTPRLESLNIKEWYRFLNCGYKLPAVGGTDKMYAGMPVGGVRTYAFLGQKEFTFDNWAEAVRAGRTFTTSGPLIDLSVEGLSPGDEILMPPGGGTLEVKAWAYGVQPFHNLQLILNGHVIESNVVDNGTTQNILQTKIHVRGSAWIAARCISRYKVWHGWPVNIAAHTSPVYIRIDGDELFNPTDAAYMLTLIDGGLTWLRTLSVPASREHSERIKQVFHAAKTTIENRLENHKHSI